MIAQIDSIGAKFTALATQALALLLGAVVLLGTIWVVWNLLVTMWKNPSAGKLAAIVGIGMFAVFLAGAAPGALDTAYAYGQSFWSAP
ncbi:MAG: hypothetical protein AAF467_23350 [Actinomycetota bacterium]